MKHIIYLLFLILSVQSAFAQETKFFDNKTIQEFQLEAPFSKIHKTKKEKSFLEAKNQKFEGFISYVNELGLEQRLPVKISIKGFSSIQLCEFPKLELKIENGSASIFKDTKKVDLNTHCDDPDSSPQNPPPSVLSQTSKSMYNAHREVVSYQIQQTLGLKFFLTKPVLVK